MKEKFTFSLFSQFINQILTLIANYFLVLFIDVEIMGLWALLNSFINLGFIFNDLGLTSIHYQYSEKKNFNDYFGSFFVIKIFLIGINVFLSLILVFVFGLFYYPYFSVILVLLFSNILSSLLNIFITNLNAKLKIFKAEIPFLIFTSFLNIVKILIALNIQLFTNPLLILSATIALFNSLHILIIIIIVKKDFKLNKPNILYIKSYIRDSSHLILYYILSVISSNVGNLILAYSFNLSTLAYFNLVNSYLIPLFGVISITMISICTPLYSRLFANSKLNLVEKISHLIEKYISILFLSIILIIFAFGDLLFELFLPHYINSLFILKLMLIFVYLSGVNRSYSLILISGKKQKMSAYLSIINVSLILSLIVFLIPKIFAGLGTTGYAFAYIVPSFIISFNLRYITWKLLKIKPNKEIIFHILISALVILIFLILRFYLKEFIFYNKIFYLIFSIILSLGTFFGLLFFFKLLRKEDIKFILKLFKIENYTSSIREEFLKV